MQIWNPQPTRRPDPTTCTLPPQSPTHLASFASFFGGVQPNQVVQVELRHQRLGCWPLQGQHALRRRRQRLGALRLARGTPLGLERRLVRLTGPQRRRLRACRGAGRAPVSGPVRRGEGDLARVHGTSPTSVTAARTERKRAQSRKRLSILYGACARLPSRLPPPSSPPLAVARARMSRLAQRCARRAGGAPKDAGSAGRVFDSPRLRLGALARRWRRAWLHDGRKYAPRGAVGPHFPPLVVCYCLGAAACGPRRPWFTCCRRGRAPHRPAPLQQPRRAAASAARGVAHGTSGQARGGPAQRHGAHDPRARTRKDPTEEASQATRGGFQRVLADKVPPPGRREAS